MRTIFISMAQITSLKGAFDSFHEGSHFPHLLDFCPWALRYFIPEVQVSKLFCANFRNASTHLHAINNDSSLIHQFFFLANFPFRVGLEFFPTHESVFLKVLFGNLQVFLQETKNLAQ